jgi:hypothetical protein
MKESGNLVIEKANINYFTDIYCELIFHLHNEDGFISHNKIDLIGYNIKTAFTQLLYYM